MQIPKIVPVRFDNFKVPGSEMITKTNWPKYYPADRDEMTNWALRSILIGNRHKNILIDTGFGNKQDDAFFRSFHLNGGFSLAKQLADQGLTNTDITDIVLTHLHFDHCGGCLLNENGGVVPAFPKATLWISNQQWDSAQHPSEKEIGSFLPENIKPLPDHYPVNFISEEGSYLPNIYFRMVHGHTAGQIIPIVQMKDKNFLFGADLFPSSAHLSPDVNMVYDIDPELATKEKELFLTECFSNHSIIIFQHSLYIESCTLKKLNNKIVMDKAQ